MRNYPLKMMLILLLTILIFHYSTVADANELVLKDRPLTESQILTTIDLFSQEKVMGQEQAPIKMLEARISIGRENISFISPSKKSHSNTVNMTPDRSKRDLYLICVPFTLPEPADNKHYQKVVFRVELDNNDAIAFDLIPKNVTSKENVTKTYTISPQLKFEGIEGKIGEFGKSISFEKLIPTITAFGEGENTFYWIYTGQHDQPVYPGTKYAVIILDVPRGTRSVIGSIWCEAEMVYEIFGNLLPRQARTARYQIKWNLESNRPIK